MAIKKCISNPHKARSAGLEKVFGSKAPLATPLKTCIGGVSFFKYAWRHAATISNAPAISPAVNALAKNDLLISNNCFFRIVSLFGDDEKLNIRNNEGAKKMAELHKRFLVSHSL